MKKCFLAYFDILGFKEFILNSSDDNILIGRMGHVFRDIENALSLGKLQEPKGGYVIADLNQSKINCINISDTILFWTNDCSIESFTEILEVSYRFNWTMIGFNMPIRGVLICGDVRLVNGTQSNSFNGLYGVSCLYGKGVVNAHLRTEEQDWAGTVIDQSIFEELIDIKELNKLIENYALKYMVPYKQPKQNQRKEYVFKLVKGNLNNEAFNNVYKRIEGNFSNDNKGVSNEQVKRKIKNTLDFLSIFKE